MSQVILITVGTSLFESASWKFNDTVQEHVPDYRLWEPAARDGRPGPKYNYEQRMLTPGSDAIVRDLKTALTAKNADDWASHFELEFRAECIFRYSAEIATLFKYLLEIERDEKDKDLCVKFLIDDNPDNPQHIAGVHMSAYLNLSHHLSIVAGTIEVPNLSSTSLEYLFGDNKKGYRFLNKKVEEILQENEVKIIFSGGYKIYGVLLSHFIAEYNTKFIYLYENGEKLVVVSRDEIYFDGETINCNNIFFPLGH